jgi:hypothetical protein
VNTLFLVHMIVSIIFALGFLLMPGTMFATFGATLSDIAVTMTRFFGSALLSISIVLWYVRKSGDPGFRRAAVYGNFVYWLVSVLVALNAMLSAQMNSLGWSIVVMHALFTIWYAYFVFKRG